MKPGDLVRINSDSLPLFLSDVNKQIFLVIQIGEGDIDDCVITHPRVKGMHLFPEDLIFIL